MTFRSLIFLLLLPAMAGCDSISSPNKQTAEQAKGQLFIIGGGSRPPEMIERMITETGLREGGYVVILPMASAEPDSAIIWSGEQFFKQGIDKVAGFNFLPDIQASAQQLDSIKNAALIYISGGSQSRFMDIVRNTPVYDAIHEAYNQGAMIAGTSAGAAVMSNKMITGDELRYPEYRSTFAVIESENLDLAEGLGLISTAIIDQHFVWRSRHNRLITAVIDFPDLPGIGIDESTAILVNGNTAEVVGESQVLVFRNNDESRNTFNNKTGSHNISLGVYLPGESFQIQVK